MQFLNHDLYSVILITFICILSVLFFFDKNKMSLFVQSAYKKEYLSLYIIRNLQFTFFRFLFLFGTIISVSSWLSIILIRPNIQNYLILLIQIIGIFLIRIIIITLIGLLNQKIASSKKIILITIDIEFFISILFFPLLFIITYNYFYVFDLAYIIFYFYIFLYYFQNT